MGGRGSGGVSGRGISHREKGCQRGKGGSKGERLEGWGFFGEEGFRGGPTLMGDNRLAVLPPTHTCQAGWGRETDPLSCLPSQASTNERSGLWEAAFPPKAVPEAVPSPQPLIIYWGCSLARLPPLSAAVPACRRGSEKTLGPRMCPLCPGLPTPPGLGRQRLPAPCCAARRAQAPAPSRGL